MRLDARLARQWAPAELGVHPVAGGGPLPAYVRRPHDERLRVILAPPVANSRLMVVRGEPCTGTTRAAWEAVAELLAEWPLEYPRTAAALAARLEAGIPAGTVLWLGELGRYADADGGAAALDRLVERARLDDVPYLAALLRALGTARADGAVRALVARDPARHADPDDSRETALLVTAMHAAGPETSDVTRVLADWAAEHCVIDGAQAVANLLQAMRAAGQARAVRRLLDRDPVGQSRFDDPWEAAALLAELRAAGEDGAVRRLLDRDPARLGRVDFADSVAWLLTELREAGAGEAIRTLLARDPASHVDLYDPQAIAWLVAELQLAGDVQAIRALATRVADLSGPDYLAYLAEWLEQFRAGVPLKRDGHGRGGQLPVRV